MTNFKKTILITILLTICAVLFLSLPSFADDYGLTDAAKVAGLKNEINKQTTFFGVVGLVVNAVLSLVGIIFFALTLYAGLRWMTARGDSAAVDKAKDILESAAIGLIIVISAYAIVNFVFTNLIGTGNTTPTTTPEATTETTPATT
ncbi:MAG: hypothetical protein WC543_06675 [Candidatus Omnitrophota bacterium]|jgi:uncharacterized membrane protein